MELIILSTQYCTKCKDIKEYFFKHAISPTMFDLDENKEWLEFARTNNLRDLPILILDGEIMSFEKIKEQLKLEVK